MLEKIMTGFWLATALLAASQTGALVPVWYGIGNIFICYLASSIFVTGLVRLIKREMAK